MGTVVEFLLLWAVPITGIASGIIYFKSARSEASLARRLLASAYGPTIALIYASIALLLPTDYRYRDYLRVFWWALLLPISLMVYSVARFPGHWKVHTLVPLNIVCLGWLFIIGTLAIAGE